MQKCLRNQLQGMAALHCKLAVMDGCKMDKKAMRFSAMADYMEHVAMCGNGSIQSALGALTEAVETAVIGSPMHIYGQPFDRTPWLWMETAAHLHDASSASAKETT